MLSQPRWTELSKTVSQDKSFLLEVTLQAMRNVTDSLIPVSPALTVQWVLLL